MKENAMASFSASQPIPTNMEDTINTCAIGLGGVGIVGGVIGPGADLIVIAPAWVVMTVKLADQAGQNMDEQTAKKIAIAVATGGGAMVSGSKIAATGLSWLTAPFTLGLSLVVAATANAALNAAFTKAYGRACARYFMQTDEIHSAEVMVATLLAMIGADMGLGDFKPPSGFDISA